MTMKFFTAGSPRDESSWLGLPPGGRPRADDVADLSQPGRGVHHVGDVEKDDERKRLERLRERVIPVHTDAQA